MKTYFRFNSTIYEADLSMPIDISLPLSGKNDVNCYHAPPFKEEIINFPEYNFIGSVAKGGSVNYSAIRITPHGNGTHTECVGHITSEKITIAESIKNFFFFAQVMSLEAQAYKKDKIIRLKTLKNRLRDDVEALVIRSLPNEESKKNFQYSGTNPPYLAPEIGKFLCEKGIKHLLVDLPSVDRESDGGKLRCHKAFWNFPENIRTDASITELIFVPEQVYDGLYLLNLQFLNIHTDASPSRPVLFSLKYV